MLFERERCQRLLLNKRLLHSTSLNLTALEIEDILYHLFQFVSPIELYTKITLISKHWRHLIINYKSLWSFHCESLWKGKFYIPSIASKIFKTDPLKAYKISYMDRDRNVINHHELISIKWHFRFKWDTNPLHISAVTEDEDGNPRIMFADFHEDGTLVHEPIQGQYHWKFVQIKSERSNYNHIFDYLYISNDAELNKIEKEPVCYGYDDQQKIKVGIKGKSRWIQVNHFPPLVVSRNKANWGWILQNDYVIFTSY